MLGIANQIRVYDLTITEIISSSSPKYQYYIGKRYIFGVDTRFTKEDLIKLYLNGYFDYPVSSFSSLF